MPRHLPHVDPGLFRQIRNLVDESDVGGEKRVGGVFDQFRHAPRGKHQRRAAC
jgi:hypothetical protein